MGEMNVIILTLSTNISTEGHVLTPRYGHYLTHALNHITRAVAAMDSFFALIGAHQHGTTVGPLYGKPQSWYVCVSA